MKRLLIGVLCALISTCAFAESTFWDSTKSTEGFSLSAGLGMNVASLTKQNLWGSKVGLNVGIMAEKPVLNSLSVKAGLFYTMKGAKNGGRDTGFGATLRSTLDPGYLEIPVMASYRYYLNEQIRLQFDFGPYFAFGLHGEDVKKVSGGASSPTKTVYKLFGSKGQMNRFDLGLRFGPEIVFNNKLRAGIAYEIGLTNAMSEECNSGIKNSNFMINVGYTFYSR